MIMEKKNSFIKYFILITLFYYSFLLDIGNSLVFFTFLFLILLMIKIKNLINIQASILITLFIIFFLMNFGRELIFSLSTVLNWEIGKAMINNLNINELNDLSPLEVFKRYCYFWLTLSGAINHFKEVIFVMLPFLLIMFVVTYEEVKCNFHRIKNYFLDPFIIIVSFLVIFFPLLTIYILPTHAFCKYYLFIIPIFVKFLSKILGNKKILILVSTSSVLFIINTSLV